MVNSINIVVDDSDYVFRRSLSAQISGGAQLPNGHVVTVTHAQDAEMNASAISNSSAADEVNQRKMLLQKYGFGSPGVQIENNGLFELFDQLEDQQQEYFDLDDPDNQRWMTHRGSPQPRPRPNYTFTATDRSAFLQKIERSIQRDDDETFQVLCASYSSSNDTTAYVMIATELALNAMKDLPWKEVLKGPDAEKAIAALNAEKESMYSNVLQRLNPGDPEYDTAVKQAITARVLLDVKRSGIWKARIVKHGFKENKAFADGPDFNYHAHVAKLAAIRATIFRPNRDTRRMAIKDVRTAFQQSNHFPDSVRKYMVFTDPLTGVKEYSRQYSPMYGECSAPVNWENTLSPVLEDQGFIRGMNEPSIFCNPQTDLLALVYVDDNFYDGEEDAIYHAAERLDDRFDCKDLEWVSIDGTQSDYIGMELSVKGEHVTSSMVKYTLAAIDKLNLGKLTHFKTPISTDVDFGSKLIPSDQCKTYMTGIGIAGWFANTVRPDISFAHSRLSQYLAAPTESAMSALKHLFGYLESTTKSCLRGDLYSHDMDPTIDDVHQDSGLGSANHRYWEFYVHTDFASNPDPANKRKSQIGYIALVKNGQRRSPVLWGSKTSSVAFALEGIGEAHADISSGAAEVYGSANATFEFLHLRYMVEEMGMQFPVPLKLQIDNSAAKVFAEDTATKTKLKHIDCRQHWVQTLRNKSICKPVKVPTDENVADIFTRTLPMNRFEYLRDKIMYTYDQ